jgi:hypothetical protein
MIKWHMKAKVMEVEKIVQQIYLNRHPEEVFFRELVSKFEIKLSGDYPDSIFYMIDDEIYMRQNKKTKFIWIRYEDFWTVFQTKFGYNHQETQELLRGMLVKHLKLKGYTPPNGLYYSNGWLERHLRLKGYTPHSTRLLI